MMLILQSTCTDVATNNPVIVDHTTSIAEDATNGTAIYDVNDDNTGNDTDLDGQVLTYNITAGNGDGIFGIDAVTGEITVVDNTNLDYETTTSYSLTVQAEDTDANTDDAIITIDVTNVNEFNPVIVDNTVSIPETIANGADVYDINDENTGNDTDADGQALTYTISNGNQDGVFAIDPATGEITIADNSSIDADETPSYVLNVVAQDDDLNTDDANITINVSDVATNNPVIVDHTTSIAEDATNGTAVYDVNDNNTGNDTDLDGQALTYSITAGNGDGVFGIDAATGEITVVDNTNLDYETTTSYSLTVQAEDTDANTDDAIITIDITDVVEGNNPVIVDHTTSIAEDATNGTAVYDVNDDNTGNDTDLDGHALTYIITTGNGDGIFGIDAATGEITVVDNTNLDYETTTSYSLTVQAEDTDANTDDAIITIDITDVAEGNNPVIVDHTTSIAEDATNGTAVYDVNDNNTGNDTDADGQALTYIITTGNGDGIFGIDAATGEITVVDNTNLDYETTTSYNLTVQVEDTDANTDDAIITIDIIDIAEGANPDIADADVYLDEDADNDTFVYDVDDVNTGGDTDADGDVLTYDIIDGNDDDIFDIDPGTGEITVGDNSNLDYENNNVYDILVDVKDPHGNSDIATISIYIIDKTEAVTVPEGFSPNNDGFNDAFVINGLQSTDRVEIKIYNRWGTLIFEDNNYNNDWDGRVNANMSLGNNVPSGTYFYIIKINGNDKEISGYVYMKR
jgi:gliding motility-associated-like protein